jgi:AcrR family transcriptional regulator
MTQSDVRRRPGGRSARVRAAVLEATLEALGEVGLDGLSVGDVAARSGVHETSIYRRWGTRERLMVDALLSNSEQRLPIPDTGSLRGDLDAFASELAAYLSSPLGAALVRALATSDDAAVREGRAEFWQARHELAKEMIERAIARGEVPATTDPRLVLEALIGPLHFRALLTGEPLGDLPERVAALLADGLCGR